MTAAEFQRWGRYEQEYGPLNPMLRMDAAFARSLLPFLKKGTRVKDLMPWPKAPEEGPSPESVAELLNAAFKSTGGKGRKARYRRKKV